ncbi:MAG: cytidine deaminase [Bacteroidetes bacterium]|nr:cytidine deaminase [Bacteroidota bacterium]
MSKQITGNYTYEVYESTDTLNKKDLELLNAAKFALVNAYAPYSNFNVGAAVLLEDGTVITGNNQENAAYPSGLCAERVAFFYASSQHPTKKIIAVAISAKTNNQEINIPVPPCGACRQAMAEYEIKFESPIRLIMSGEKGEIFISPSVSNLLPMLFSAKNLGK